jgi:DNA polymerase
MQTPQVSLSPLPEGLADMDWATLKEAAASCQACGLCQGRHHSLFASGSVVQGPADWLIVGDAPTDAEDLAGVAFVGEEGQLLDAMLQAMGLSRTGAGASSEHVVITSAVKCHPQDKRNPSPEELMHCNAYLQRQIQLLQPKVILALGRLAAQALLQPSLGEAASQPLGKLRGQVHRVLGCPVVVSYHPAYLLRSPSDKAKAWSDLILAMQQVRPISA